MNDTLNFDISVGDVHVVFTTAYQLTPDQTAEVVQCARNAIEYRQKEDI